MRSFTEHLTRGLAGREQPASPPHTLTPRLSLTSRPSPGRTGRADSGAEAQQLMGAKGRTPSEQMPLELLRLQGRMGLNSTGWRVPHRPREAQGNPGGRRRLLR